jgi:hypothetical protein
MAEKCMLHGTPTQLAEQLKPFIDQGVNWFSLTDFMPLVLDPQDAIKSHERMLEIAHILQDYAGKRGAASVASAQGVQ